MGLRITVPPKGKVIVNQAVIQNNGSEQADLYVLNRANVIREKNIMQHEEATTPSRRAYFLMQSMIMEDVRGADPRIGMFTEMLDDLLGAFSQSDVLMRLRDSRRLAGEGDLYRAMMALKTVIKYEDAVLALGQAIEVETSLARGEASLLPQET